MRYCYKCGNILDNEAVFCSKCGAKQNDESLEQEIVKTESAQKQHLRLSMLFLGIGTGLALLIFLISWAEYGIIFFFNGYLITKIGWILSFISLGIGTLMFVSKAIRNKGVLSNNKHIIVLPCVLIATSIAIIVSAIIINEAGQKTQPNYNDYDSDYIQNAFESCHSTAEHIQAIYSYDINNDNYLSEYELELFAKAHPRFVQDKVFMQWVDSHLG